jgi:molybdopterin-guanine dinucleotide biosynthesis protein A
MKWSEVTFMVTAVILAGGKSTRMGQDKALMRGGVRRIVKMVTRMNIDRAIVLCGPPSRKELFDGEVWPDPSTSRSLMDVLLWVFEQIDDDIQLIPCDAFELEHGGLQSLIDSKGGVPLDQQGIRQPMLSHCPKGWKPNEHGATIQDLFSELPSLDVGPFVEQMKNFNRPTD